jgi:Spy/CpxP family protein refolding chaperone
MKNWIRMTVAAGVLAVSGLALAPLFAQDGPPQGGPPMRRMGPGGPGGPGFGPGPGGPLGDLGFALRQLELTDTQREQVRGVMQAHQAEFKELGDRMRTAREALDAAISADTIDESAIRGRSAEWAAVEADGAVLRARVRQEVFGLLTPEQQAKAKELKAQMQQRMKQRADRIRERGVERRERHAQQHPLQG